MIPASFLESKWYTTNRSLIIKSIIIVLLAVCILSSPIRSKTFDHSLVTKIDTYCTAYLDQSLEQAAIAYGIARLTNGLVSVLQKIDLGIEFGIAATMNPFEILDPLNDLVERFSWVLLVSIISISIQEFLIRFFSASIIDYILLPGLTLWFMGLWFNQFLRIDLVKMGKQLVLLAFILRFIIPAEVAIGSWVYTKHLKPRHAAAIEAVEADSLRIREKIPVYHPVSKTKEMIATVKQLPKKFNDFKIWIEQLVPELIENFLNLIIIFAINTIFLPIFTLWLILYLLRIITGSRTGHAAEKKFKNKIFKKTTA